MSAEIPRAPEGARDKVQAPLTSCWHWLGVLLLPLVLCDVPRVQAGALQTSWGSSAVGGDQHASLKGQRILEVGEVVYRASMSLQPRLSGWHEFSATGVGRQGCFRFADGRPPVWWSTAALVLQDTQGTIKIALLNSHASAGVAVSVHAIERVQCPWENTPAP